MTAHEKIRHWQEQNHFDTFQAAKVIGINEMTYFVVSEGSVTAPGIAKKFQRVIGFTDEEAEELMPENRRPLTEPEKYDPDKWVERISIRYQ